MKWFQLEDNSIIESCSGSEAGSYSSLKDSVYHPHLGFRVIEKRKKKQFQGQGLMVSAPDPSIREWWEPPVVEKLLYMLLH